MKIAVVAANGRSGRAFVERALEAGHEVRAGVHGQPDLPEHDRLTVMRCDALDPVAVATLIAGQDAVASFIGHVKGSPARVQRDAMTILVSAMKATSVRRIVSLTGTGVRFEGDQIGLIDWFLNLSITIIDPNRVHDGIEHANVLKQSGLDWTIVRVLKLQDFPSRPYALRAHGPTRLYVNRDEVAQAVLQVLEHDEYIGEAPIISRP
jgi:nucleoside-diphosphate-sugar epimerase